MPDSNERRFDLNVEKILEGWEICHAAREIIANALDEQVLTGTRNVDISKDRKGVWHIRDFGRGLKYEHLTQNENREKLKNPTKVIGKFGVGLKDALATLSRRKVDVLIRSKYGDISLERTPKHGFTDVVTLHAVVKGASDPGLVGTDFGLSGVSDADISAAKNFFLKFSNQAVLDETSYGQILGTGNGCKSRIYVTGMLVAEEENFAFSYNITSLTATMRKALNRERTNVGRTAYSDRVKQMLLASKAAPVAEALAEGTIARRAELPEVAQVLSAAGHVHRHVDAVRRFVGESAVRADVHPADLHLEGELALDGVHFVFELTCGRAQRPRWVRDEQVSLGRPDRRLLLVLAPAAARRPQSQRREKQPRANYS